MAKRDGPYHVVPNKEKGGWEVKREGASRASSFHRKKKRAVKKAKSAALNAQVGVTVHRMDGTTHYGYDYESLSKSPHNR